MIEKTRNKLGQGSPRRRINPQAPPKHAQPNLQNVNKLNGFKRQTTPDYERRCMAPGAAVVHCSLFSDGWLGSDGPHDPATWDGAATICPQRHDSAIWGQTAATRY